MNIYTYFLLVNPNSLSSLYGIYCIRLYKGFSFSFQYTAYIVYIISSLYTFSLLYIFSFKSVYFFSISSQHRSFWCHYKLSHHVHIAGYYAHRRWIWMVAKCLPACLPGQVYNGQVRLFTFTSTSTGTGTGTWSLDFQLTRLTRLTRVCWGCTGCWAQKSQKIKNNCQHRRTMWEKENEGDAYGVIILNFWYALAKRANCVEEASTSGDAATQRRCGDIDRSILMETRFIWQRRLYFQI